MKSMPFIDKLMHWAETRGGHPAVVVGEEKLDYVQLLRAAETGPQEAVLPASALPDILPEPDRLAVIDVPTSTRLAGDFCAAVLRGRTAMVLDASWPAPVRLGLLHAAADWASRQPRGSGASTPFLLGVSSGTSGLPKAFVRSAASWHESFVHSVAFFGAGPESVTLAPGPLAASMNLYALGESIFAGSTFVALPRFSPDTALKSMVDYPVNRLVLVPTILELIAARGLATGQRGDGIRSIVCAGSGISAATLALAREWAPNAHIQQYYGAAELGFVAAGTVARPASSVPAGDAAASPLDGVGMAFPGVQITIRDDDGSDMAPGRHGNIWVSSPYVCDGYAWGDDGLAFRSQQIAAAGTGNLGGNTGAGPRPSASWHTVRDQGRLDAGNTLHLAGRASDMILTSGANVYPHEVERALAAAARHAEVSATANGIRNVTVVVAGIPDALRGQRVVAGVWVAPAADNGTPADSAGLTAAGQHHRGPANAALLQALRRAAGQLPAPQRPSQYFELSMLPLTGSGKISRPLLARWINEKDPRARRLH